MRLRMFVTSMAVAVLAAMAAPALAQPTEPEPSPVITTYTWDGGGFIPHSSFNGSFLGDEVRIAFDAWNWSPEYPALTVQWDNVFSGVDLVLDDFNDGVIDPIWGVTRSPGAGVFESGGVATSVIPEGTTPNGSNHVAGLYTSGLILSGDFDVAIDFTLSPGFHTNPGSAAKFLTQDAAGFFAELGIRPGSFESNEVGPNVWINHGITPTDQLEGRLRITRTSSAWFDGHEYMIFGAPLSWHDAVDHCANIGGHLVTIGSAEENAFVFGLTAHTWLGATDEVAEGVWEWVTGEPFAYTNWAQGEPNNRDGFPPHGPEHYLTFTFDGQWNDVPIHSQIGYVCEFDHDSANEMATDAVDALDELVEGGTLPGDVAESIDDALRHLAKALNPALWVDETHLVADGGAKVFNQGKKAVGDLLDAMSMADGAAADEIAAVIDALVAAERLLAETAIDDAIAAAGIELYIDKALARLAAGDELAALGDFGGAVKLYRKAWVKGLEAIGAFG